MISRFFIDRPIFATVLSIVITLIGGIALFYLPIAQYPRITPPGVSGLDQLSRRQRPGGGRHGGGADRAAGQRREGMLYMSSQMGNDGSYTLTVTFDIGIDLNTALVMVQNRVALAMPQLPTQVQNQGITIRKKTPDILMIVNFISPDRRYDDIYLSNYAMINVKDELLRVDGVSDISYHGPARLQHSRLARSAKAGGAQHDRQRRGQRDSQPERGGGAGQIGQPPRRRANPFNCRSIRWAGSTTPSSSATSSSRSPRIGLAPTALPASPRSGPSACRCPARPRPLQNFQPWAEWPARESSPATSAVASEHVAGTATIGPAAASRPPRCDELGAVPTDAVTGGGGTGGGASASGGGSTSGGGTSGGGGTTGGAPWRVGRDNDHAAPPRARQPWPAAPRPAR